LDLEPTPFIELDDSTMKNSDQAHENQESKNGLNARHKEQGEDDPEKYLIF